MRKTLSKWFITTIKDEKIEISQRASDVTICQHFILDIADDVTDEEYKILREAMEILKKHDK